MKIAVNTRFLLKNKLEGIGIFTHETLKRIVHKHPEVEFVFIFDRKYDKSFIYGDNVEPIVAFPPARHPFLWYLWFEFSVPRVLRREKPDLFLSTDGYCSLSTNVLQNMVIHDLAFEHDDASLDKLKLRYYKYYTPRFVKKARHITTVSQFTKQDITEQYGTNPQKIDVVFNGIKDHLGPIDKSSIQGVRDRWSAGCAYFLFIGALHHRKNIINLFKAFDQFKERHPSPVKLLIAGRKGWGTSDIEETYNALKNKADVLFTDRVNEQELHELLAAGLALTYVPFLEGFGIPIIEAQSCDLPVITSNRTSMPEVAADSAHLVDPFSVDSISEGLVKVWKDADYRESLVEKGKVNCKRFSWDLTSDLLWESMMKTLK